MRILRIKKSFSLFPLIGIGFEDRYKMITQSEARELIINKL